MTNRKWANAGVCHGYQDNVGVWANRYMDPNGEVAWNVRVVPPNATQTSIYFVVSYEFYATLRTDIVPGGNGQVETSAAPVDVDPLQKAAVLKLIRRWEEDGCDEGA